MTPPEISPNVDESDDIVETLDFLGRHTGNGSARDLLMRAGVSRSTAYRRMGDEDEITVGELRQVGRLVNVPSNVILAGKMAVMRWLVDRPDGGPGLPIQHSTCMADVVPLRARRTATPSLAAAA